LVRLPLVEGVSAVGRGAAVPGGAVEERLFLGRTVGLELEPPLGSELVLAERLGLGDVAQELLLEIVRHSKQG
jgi:hypothetical protein